MDRRNSFVRSVRAALLGPAALLVLASAVGAGVLDAATPGGTDAAVATGRVPVRPLASPSPVRPLPTVPAGNYAPATFQPSSPEVRELVNKRTATSSTWVDADGAMQVDLYAEPKYYKPAGSTSYVTIVTTLRPDTAQTGWFEAAANTWTTVFGPSSASTSFVELSEPGGSIGFDAAGSATVDPVVSGSTATYDGVWPDVDATYHVTTSGVVEDLTLQSPSAPSSYTFDLTAGVTAEPGSVTGGLELVRGGAAAGTVPPPTVTTAQHVTVPAATSGATLQAVPDGTGRVGGGITVSVSQAWLNGLPASAFPLTIDPSVTEVYSPGSAESINTSNVKNTSVVQIGRRSSKKWRSFVQFPYTSYLGQTPPWYVETADMYLVDQTGSSSSSEPVSIYLDKTEPTTFASVESGSVVATATDSGTGTGTISLTSAMQTVFAAPSSGEEYLGLVGKETGSTTLKIYGESSNSFENIELQVFLAKAPPATSVVSPANGATVFTATPTLTANPVATPTTAHVTMQYQFQISTDEDGAGEIVNSGWLHCVSSCGASWPRWTVPQGSLTNGATYYVRALTAVLPGTVPPLPPLTVHQVKVTLHLGAGGSSPTDTVGAAPGATTTPSAGSPSPDAQPSSETVNLVTGDLAFTEGTHSLATLGGPAGLTLGYNSLEPGENGLLGQYYFDADGTHSFDSTNVLVGQRLDGMIDGDWSSGTPPVGGLTDKPFLVKWTGSITVPTPGTWKFGVQSTGGMRVYLNGSSTPAVTDWSGDDSPTVPTFGSTVTVSAGSHQITVEAWNTASDAVDQFWMENTHADTDPEYLVPSDWLAPGSSTLPSGWALSAGASSASWTSLDDLGSTVVLQSAAGGTASFTRTAPGHYQAPPGYANLLLTVNDQGEFQLSTPTNQLYTFNPNGTVASLATVISSLHPTALQYTYTGSPLVLSKITDPVSGRHVTLLYGGTGSCPSTSHAPTGMLCVVKYWDSTQTVLVYNANGQLTQVTNPGTSIADFAYASTGRLDAIRDPLANEAISAGVEPTCPAAGTTEKCETQITYNGSGQVATVTQPAPTPGAARPKRTYTYSVPVAGSPIADDYDPVSIAVAPDGSKAYVGSAYSDTVTPITLSTDTTGTAVTVGGVPNAIAITPNGAKAYVAESNGVTPITLSTGSAGTAISVGSDPDAIAITPSGAKAYVALYGSTSVKPITLSTGAVGTAVTVGSHPSAIAITPNGAKAYVANATSSSVTPITLSSGTAETAIHVGSDPDAIAITPDGARAYVANRDSSSVTPITLSSGTAETSIGVGHTPIGVAITPDGVRAYVANYDSSSVTPITLSTGRAETAISIGDTPTAIAITPNGIKAYVAVWGTSSVTPMTISTDTTEMSIAGFSPSSGYAEKVTYDSRGQITSETGSTGTLTSRTFWNSVTEPVATIQPSGEESTTFYNLDGEVTGTYGPAPTACFDPTTYVPVTDPLTTTGCGVAVPHTETGYDQGMTGLAATYWTNATFSGTPALYGTTAGSTLSESWSSPPVGTGAWSLRLTGTVDLATAGTWTFGSETTQSVKVYISGQLITSNTHGSGGPGNWSSSLDNDTFSVATPGVYPIDVDFTGAASTLSAFYVEDQSPGGSESDVAASTLDPNYGLKTSVTTPDGDVTDYSYTDPADDVGPQDGLVTATTKDPGGLNLTTTTDYENPSRSSALTPPVLSAPIGIGTTVNAMAITPNGATAYIASTAAGTTGNNTVTPITVATNTAGTPIDVGIDPRAIAITPNGATAYVVNEDSGSVTPITVARNTAGTAISVGTYPNAIAITPNGATAYVVNGYSNSVTPITVARNTAGTAISVGTSPTAIAITPNGATAYVLNSRSVTPITVATNTAGTAISVGAYPNAIAITPNGATAYVAAGFSSGFVLPITVATNTAGTEIPVGTSPNAIAITPNGATAYVVSASTDSVMPITVATNTAGAAITVGWSPSAIAITPNSEMAYVVNATSRSVTPITVTTNTARPSVSVGTPGTWAHSIAITPSGTAAYVSEGTTVIPITVDGPSYLRRTATVLPAGGATSYSYYSGTSGPIVAVCGVSATTPQGGQLEQQVDPAPSATTSGEARTQQFVYDSAGKEAGVRVGYLHDISTASWQCIHYNSEGAMTSETWPAYDTAAARTVTYRYGVDTDPLVNSVSDASGTVTSTVDLLGRVVSYSDASGKTTTTTYDQAGQVTATTGPAGDETETYNANTGKVATVALGGTTEATISYCTSSESTYTDPCAGQIETVAYGNGTSSSYRYNSYGDEVQANYEKGSTTFAGDEITKSPGGRELTDSPFTPTSGTFVNPRSGGGTDFTYDGAGRLVQAYITGAKVEYSYADNTTADGCADPDEGENTNLTSVVYYPTAGGTAKTDSCYNDADQLVKTITSGTASTAGSGTSTTYSYDTVGNQTANKGTTYTWDSSGKLASATSGGTTTSYTYDPVDRLLKSAGSTTTQYAYCGYTTSPCATLNSSGDVEQELVALPGGVTLTAQSSGNLWSYPNLQGDYIATTNQSGTVQGSVVTYDPFGAIYPAKSSPVNVSGSASLGAFGADGKLQDNTLAIPLVFMGARTYSPDQGRFLAVDPIEGGCANAYVYVKGDPVNSSDLSGQATCQNLDSIAVSCWTSWLPPSAGCTVSIGPTEAAQLATDLDSLGGVAAAAAVSFAICTAISVPATGPVGIAIGGVCSVAVTVGSAQIADSLRNAANNNEFVTISISTTLFSGLTVSVHTSPDEPCKDT